MKRAHEGAETGPVMRLNSLAVRLVAGAALWSLMALALGGYLLASVFRQSVEENFDDRLESVMANLLAVAMVEEGGTVTLSERLNDLRFRRAYSGWYWQIGLPRAPEAPGGEEEAGALRSRSLFDLALTVPEGQAADGGRRVGYTNGPEGQRLRVLAEDVVLPGADYPLTVAVAASTEELRAQISSFNRLLGYALAILGIGLVVAVLLQVSIGLSPLREVSRQLTELRSGRRKVMSHGLPAEIAPLASELNSFISHNAQIVERSRTHVGNLAHALKTPLSVLKNEFAARPDAADDLVRRQVDSMEGHIERYLSRARLAASSEVIGARTDVMAALTPIVRALGRLNPDKTIEIDAPMGAAPVFRGEQQDLEEVLGNLIENACKWAKRHIRIRLKEEAASLHLIIEDDGPGLPHDKAERVLQRGQRLDEAVPGSGLGLSIVADIAEAYSGRLSLAPSPLGGLQVTVQLPSAT